MLNRMTVGRRINKDICTQLTQISRINVRDTIETLGISGENLLPGERISLRRLLGVQQNFSPCKFSFFSNRVFRPLPSQRILFRSIHSSTIRSIAIQNRHFAVPVSASSSYEPAMSGSDNHDSVASNAAVKQFSFDTSLSLEARKSKGVYGLLPPIVETYDTQDERCLRLLNSKTTSLEKYQFLSCIRVSNVDLFYRLMSKHFKLLNPLVYTPTVGEACEKWSEIYTHPEGLYISYTDKGNLRSIIKNWPNKVEITVITDGSRILGLGDLGVNGMGIPVGKLALYTACAGIKPTATLPLMVDFGTNNEQLLKHPLYLGHKVSRVSQDEEIEFLDELMEALTERWPDIIIQYEDWKNPFTSLRRYRHKYAMFNDDVQGTGSVIMAGFINALKQSNIPLKEHRAVFFGSGSAAVGVAREIVENIKSHGIDEDDARKMFWFVDSRGLVTMDRGDKLAEHKLYFARTDNNGKQYSNLLAVIDYVRPTILMGFSTVGGAFTKEVIEKMASLNDRPIIFPLSNPSNHSECSFEDAIRYTHGKCVFAAGSPFDPVTFEGKVYEASQGNNMYVFPAIGLGAICCQAKQVTQSMIYGSAIALADCVLPSEFQRSLLYPDMDRIREVSANVAVKVIREAQKAGVDGNTVLRDMNDDQLLNFLKHEMYDPFSVASIDMRSSKNLDVTSVKSTNLHDKSGDNDVKAVL